VCVGSWKLFTTLHVTTREVGVLRDSTI